MTIIRFWVNFKKLNILTIKSSRKPLTKKEKRIYVIWTRPIETLGDLDGVTRLLPEEGGWRLMEIKAIYNHTKIKVASPHFVNTSVDEHI